MNLISLRQDWRSFSVELREEDAAAALLTEGDVARALGSDCCKVKAAVEESGT